MRASIAIGVVVACLADVPSVEARPVYLKVFKQVYPELAKRSPSCAICHPRGDDKTLENHYGAALEEELGGKNVGDEARIMQAILEIEKGKCKSGPWRRRLNALHAPCVDREVFGATDEPDAGASYCRAGQADAGVYMC